MIFDKHAVTTRATFQTPQGYAEAIPYLIVNGTVVIDRGEHTDARPGRALRRGGRST